MCNRTNVEFPCFSSHPGNSHVHHVTKPSEACVHQNITALQQNTVHSRSSSRDSVDSVIENKNYRPERPNSASSNSSQKQLTPLVSNSSQNTNHERTMSNGSNSADIYGTLPRKHSRKPVNKSTGATSNTQDNEVYRDFLNRQKSMGNVSSQANGAQTIDAQSCDSRMESQFQMPSQHHIRTNVAEIRPLHQSGNGTYQQQTDQSWQQASRLHGDAHTEVCTTPAALPQTAKAHPVTPPKPRQVSDPPSLPRKRESSLPPSNRKCLVEQAETDSTLKGKSSTYKAGNKSTVTSIHSAIPTSKPGIYSRSGSTSLARHASFTQPSSSGRSFVNTTRTLERLPSQPDCQKPAQQSTNANNSGTTNQMILYNRSFL